MTTTSATSRRLSGRLHTIGRGADRFERDELVAAALADHRSSEVEIRRHDATITRRLEVMTLPVLAFAIGFGLAFGL